MVERQEINIRKYFAAANSYTGFVSYFDSVFSPEEFERIYLLKGGPGTGKSSLMKNIALTFKDKKCCVEELYCSSDPNSLDGVIISNKDKRVAIIDATFPHERDTRFPGAIDELINLGDGWDTAWIIGQKQEIVSLGKEKSSAYKAAYSYMALAGQAERIIKDCYKSKFSVTKAKSWAEAILGDIKSSKNPNKKTRLISSFGRLGTYSLELPEELNSKKIGICGDVITVGLILSFCLDFLKCKCTNIVCIPSPLDPCLTEGIYLPDSGILLCQANTAEINATDFFVISDVEKERIKKAFLLKKDALDEAQRWFSIASDIHFRLEKIYSAAMDFEKNNKIILDKTKEIANILEITI